MATTDATKATKATEATVVLLPDGLETSLLPLLDIYCHVQKAVTCLVDKEKFPDSDQQMEQMTILMEKVAKLSAHIYKGLGAILYSRWLEFNNMEDILRLLDIFNDELQNQNESIVKECKTSIMYLKLAVMCNIENARHTYADLLKKDGCYSLPHDAVRYFELIKICNYGFRGGSTSMHEFVAEGLQLIPYAYSIHEPECESTRTYKLYVELTHAINKGKIPHGLIHGYDGDATTTVEMANFLVNLLEGGRY